MMKLLTTKAIAIAFLLNTAISNADATEISTTTLTLPGQLIEQVMKGPAAGSSDDDLYRILVKKFEDAESEVVSHFTSTTPTNNQLEFNASRSIAAPWYINMGHLDWAQRYNPRDIGNGMDSGSQIKIAP